MYFKITGIFISLFVVTNCSYKNQDPFWFLDKGEDFKRITAVFADYIDFYPKSSDASCVNSTWSLDPYDEFNIKTAFSYSESKFYQTKTILKERSIAQYLSNENCLLVLNRFTTNNNYGYPEDSEIDLKLIDLDCYNDLYPIPNFSNFKRYQSNNSVCKLQNDFVIYVLEAESGRFLEDSKLPDGKYMPKEWRHGYSKGVAISDARKVIIYWVIIW